MYLKYNESCEEFTREELRHISGALGFPKDLFDKNLPEEYLNDGGIISMRDLLKCIDERCFNVDLHYTVNLKSGAYNASCLQKAVNFISMRFLSFDELLGVRLAFQAYEEYDQKGMKIDEYTFLRALKMCGRVISPQKLMHKVKYLKSSYQEQGRIQLFEFLDLLTLCEYSDKYHVSDDLKSPVEKTWTKLYEIDNFRQFTTPKDKKLWRHLNKEYREKELQYNKPKLKSHEFVVNPLKSEAFRTQVKVCNQKYEMLHRNLKDSSKQVQLAKGGFYFVPPKSVASTVSASPSRFTAMSSPSVQARPPSRVLTETLIKGERWKLKRPQSSPPVVSKQLADDSRQKVHNVQFQICTEKQRWAAHYLENISARLPNYPEVLKRMRKPPTAPRRKKFYRKERPSRAIINKLANHETQPPTEHIEHCDALVHGVGMDKHSVQLQKQAKKIRSKSAPVVSSTSRAKSASTSTSKRQAKYSALLETLLVENGYVSQDDISDEEVEIKVENTLRKEDDVIVEEATVVPPNSDVESSSDESEKIIHHEEAGECKDETLPCDAQVEPFTKETFLEEMSKWKQQKVLNIEDFLKESGYYRIFIKPPSREGKSVKNEEEEEENQPLAERAHQLPEKKALANLEPPSEFEQEIRNFKNIKLPHDVLLFEEVEDLGEKKRRMKSLKRISQRFPPKDRGWFMHMAREQEKVTLGVSKRNLLLTQ